MDDLIQSQPDPPLDRIQSSLPLALDHLTTSHLTDAEFLFTPSQIALACWQLADGEIVSLYLKWKYGQEGELQFGIARDALEEKLRSVAETISSGPEMDMKLVKSVDKRLKGCTNPEKVPGTAL